MLHTSVARVHLVEDDPETASALALLLTAAGYDVETTFDAEGALIAAEANQPEIELLDLDAPETSAQELAHCLRARLDRLNRIEEEPEIVRFPKKQARPAVA